MSKSDKSLALALVIILILVLAGLVLFIALGSINVIKESIKITDTVSDPSSETTDAVADNTSPPTTTAAANNDEVGQTENKARNEVVTDFHPHSFRPQKDCRLGLENFYGFGGQIPDFKERLYRLGEAARKCRKEDGLARCVARCCLDCETEQEARHCFSGCVCPVYHVGGFIFG